MSGLFEHLAATDDSEFIAHRKASAVANKRVKDRLGAFLANAKDDLPARLALVEDDITEIVKDVVAEYGGDAQKIEAAIKRSIVPMPPSVPPQAPGMPAQGMGPAHGGGQGSCPQCGGPLMNGQCATCQGTAAGGGTPGGMPYALNHSMPQSPSSGPITAKGAFCDDCGGWKSGPNKNCTCSGEESNDDSEDTHEPGEDGHESSVHTARRPKMCPYHSEVVDISLGAGDPQSGFNAMAAHAWGDKHCKGAYEGTCNFRPAMVTQKHWDDKKNEYEERRQQRDLERQQQPVVPEAQELSIDTEPIMQAEPLSEEPGKEGVTDLDGELANAPSAVGAGELAMAASTQKEAEALETVDLPKGNESALGGPSPKIDKANSGDERGWSLEPIDTQMDGSPNPKIEEDVTDKAEYDKRDFLDQTNAVAKKEELPTGKGLDGGGFNTERNITQYPTKTFDDNGTDPVTRTPLSSVDPDKNPIRELLEEYEGFLMPNQVESALRDWEVG